MPSSSRPAGAYLAYGIESAGSMHAVKRSSIMRRWEGLPQSATAPRFPNVMAGFDFMLCLRAMSRPKQFLPDTYIEGSTLTSKSNKKTRTTMAQRRGT